MAADLAKYSKLLSPEDFAAFQQAVNDQNAAFQAVQDFQNTLPQNVRREDGYDAVIATPAYQQFQDAQQRMQAVLDANPKAFGADPRAGRPTVNLSTLYQQDARNPNNIVKYDPAGVRSAKNSFLSKIGGGLANTIGENPWVLGLPMLAAAAPALVGATGLSSAGAAGTTAAAAPAASGGGFFSSLLSAPSTVSSYVGNLTGNSILGSAAGGALKGAAIGAGTGALTGQNIGKSALAGGVSGGTLGAAGNLAGQALGGTQLGDFLGYGGGSGTAGELSDVLPFTPSGFSSASSTLPSASSFKLSDLLGGGDGIGLRDVVGAGNSYLSNKNALKAIQNGQNNALNTLQPYLASGGAANARLSDLLGTSGNSGAAGYGSLTTPFTADNLQNDAGYKFRLQQGQQALDRQQAARGGFFSGNALKAAQDFGQGLADTTFNDAFQRDAATKNQQYGMFANQAGQGQAAANQAGDIYTQAGQAKADSTIRSGNIFSQLLAGSGARYGKKTDAYGNTYYA